MKTFLVCFGTRPEAIKLYPLIRELKGRHGVRTVVAVSGQHREMLDQVLSAFGLSVDYDLSLMRSEQTLTALTAAVLTAVGRILDEVLPDALIVQGDTTTAYAASLAAFYRRIPICHIEAGLRTYDPFSPFPEEMNRRMISCLASFHFAPTEGARHNLIKEGIAGDRILVSGNTVVDALRLTVREDFSHELLSLAKGRRLILLTAHRRENIGKPLAEILSGIRSAIEGRDDVCVIYPLHKNPAVRRIAEKVLHGCREIHMTEPLDVVTFHNLISRCDLILSDSGGVQEEAASLARPLLVLRDSTEREEGIRSGSLFLVGTDREAVRRVLLDFLEERMRFDKNLADRLVFGDGNASAKIADFLTKKASL